MLRTKYDQAKTVKELVTEAYYGGSANLNKGVGALTKICAKISACTEHELVRLNINESPENKILEEALKKEFGFKEIHVYWDNQASPNAYSIVGGLLLNPNPDEEHAKTRQDNKYYDHNHEYNCVIVCIMNLVRKLELTPRETMGILLHEVGHNFDHCATTYAAKLIGFLFSFGLSDVFGAINKNIATPLSAFIQNRLPVLSKFGALIQDINYHLSYAPRIQTDIPHMLFGLLLTPAEYHSDSFAASYGFGVDLASAINKLDDDRKSTGFVRGTLYNTPLLQTLYDLYAVPTETFAQIFDAHPFNENRIKAIKQSLEKDLNDPAVPKSLKPQIKKEIENVQKLHDLNIKMEGREGQIFTYIRKQLLK